MNAFFASDPTPPPEPPLAAATKVVAKSDPRIDHAQAIKSPATDRAVYNNLITRYSRTNLLHYSVRLFYQIPFPDIVSWTAFISAHSNTFLSLRHFVSMLRYPTFPNERTLASLFKTCASLPCVSFGLALHSLAYKLSLCNDRYSGSALVNFYSKCRLFNHACKVFDEISDRDEFCYSALVVGLAQNAQSIPALSMFRQMKASEVASTIYSVSGALCAAADLAALERCRVLHSHAVVTGLDTNVIVQTALIDAYGKSGLIIEARQVFDENLGCMNIVGWNAILSSYAQQGDQNSTRELFNSMKAFRMSPDEYSFLAILSSFCNAGSVGEIKPWLRRMIVEYGVKPTLEHFTCLIDALGRAGKLEEAERVAMTMPFVPDEAVWRALLTSSASHGAGDMAWKMAKRLLELNLHDDSAYVIVANALSATARWEEVAVVRKLMKERDVKKKSGRSWIEVRGEVHVFLAGDRNHERAEELNAKLKELVGEIEKLGYVPICGEVLQEVGEKEKKEALLYHSEKLALAYGILTGVALPGKALRIVKNLRICRDCHQFFKYASRVLKKEIIVRDVNRYHRFSYGGCTCADIW
ncbi:hypothetical protein IC582_012540 [Cucumis melo]|uniref:Pentatricopeptide repeat-containing protein At4g33170-like n=2 Tax=Cucumis melo TaxID=3656 RepID=A0A1S3AX28_CUCME|nr:pentatricopeptide repeat-containing protein At4g33170-like isoform X1 [Cucumis melo]KAA0049210.1 pentatricopeptide repeat-containing protein [Cucumis melo var. makuwa]TYK17348.1 pentatricopeptide repeat-containing protein [Cucumis melo var. makuwa]